MIPTGNLLWHGLANPCGKQMGVLFLILKTGGRSSFCWPNTRRPGGIAGIEVACPNGNEWPALRCIARPAFGLHCGAQKQPVLTPVAGIRGDWPLPTALGFGCDHPSTGRRDVLQLPAAVWYWGGHCARQLHYTTAGERAPCSTMWVPCRAFCLAYCGTCSISRNLLFRGTHRISSRPTRYCTVRALIHHRNIS